MPSEASNQRQIWLALGSAACRLFRLNTGRGWISNMGPKGVQRLADGSVLIKGARSIALGLSSPNGDPIVGACDLPGYTIVEITPEMVGRKVAVFTSVEVKTTKGGKVSAEQENWAAQVEKAGGIAVIARSPEEALLKIEAWKHKNC